MSEHVVFYSFSNSTQVNTPMSEHVVFYSFSNLTEVKPPMSVLLLWKGKPCRCMCFSFPVPSLLLVVKFLFKNLKIHRASFSTKGEGNLSNHWSTSQSYDTNIILILMNQPDQIAFEACSLQQLAYRNFYFLFLEGKRTRQIHYQWEGVLNQHPFPCLRDRGWELRLSALGNFSQLAFLCQCSSPVNYYFSISPSSQNP